MAGYFLGDGEQGRRLAECRFRESVKFMKLKVLLVKKIGLLLTAKRKVKYSLAGRVALYLGQLSLK